MTGARGQLGSELVAFFSGRGYPVVGVDVDEFDICDADAVRTAFKRERPDIVLHTAAYTDVDGCESNRDLAQAVNVDGTEHLAKACRKIGARMIYYSTDYVFDGEKPTPYLETDEPNPRTVYGKTKLEGEKAVASWLDEFAVLRIAWVYGKNGKNFVRTMLGLGFKQLREGKAGRIIEPLKVVDDQTGNPCWTLEIARQTERIVANSGHGVFHATSEGETTWFGLAKKIFEILDMPVLVNPCTTEQFPRPAPRPRNSSLENARLKEAGQNVMRPWDAALKEFLQQKGNGVPNEL